MSQLLPVPLLTITLFILLNKKVTYKESVQTNFINKLELLFFLLLLLWLYTFLYTLRFN